MLKNKKLIVILVSIIALIATVSCVLLIINSNDGQAKQEGGSNTKPNDFIPSLTVSEDSIDDMKNKAREEYTIDENTTAYYVDGDYEGMTGEYTYYVDKENNITYSSFMTTPAELNDRIVYNDITKEEKEELINDGYKRVEEQLSYILNTLKYTPKKIYKMFYDGTFEVLNEIPTTETLRNEFVNSETISCYLIDFETPDSKRISMSITTQGWYSISFVMVENN